VAARVTLSVEGTGGHCNRWRRTTAEPRKKKGRRQRKGERAVLNSAPSPWPTPQTYHRGRVLCRCRSEHRPAKGGKGGREKEERREGSSCRPTALLQIERAFLQNQHVLPQEGREKGGERGGKKSPRVHSHFTPAWGLLWPWQIE